MPPAYYLKSKRVEAIIKRAIRRQARDLPLPFADFVRIGACHPTVQMLPLSLRKLFKQITSGGLLDIMLSGVSRVGSVLPNIKLPSLRDISLEMPNLPNMPAWPASQTLPISRVRHYIGNRCDVVCAMMVPEAAAAVVELCQATSSTVPAQDTQLTSRLTAVISRQLRSTKTSNPLFGGILMRASLLRAFSRRPSISLYGLPASDQPMLIDWSSREADSVLFALEIICDVASAVPEPVIPSNAVDVIIKHIPVEAIGNCGFHRLRAALHSAIFKRCRAGSELWRLVHLLSGQPWARLFCSQPGVSVSGTSTKTASATIEECAQLLRRYWQQQKPGLWDQLSGAVQSPFELLQGMAGELDTLRKGAFSASLPRDLDNRPFLERTRLIFEVVAPVCTHHTLLKVNHTAHTSNNMIRLSGAQVVSHSLSAGLGTCREPRLFKFPLQNTSRVVALIRSNMRRINIDFSTSTAEMDWWQLLQLLACKPFCQVTNCSTTAQAAVRVVPHKCFGPILAHAPINFCAFQ